MLVEAKRQYTRVLIGHLHPELYRGLQTIWRDCQRRYAKAMADQAQSASAVLLDDDLAGVKSVEALFQRKLEEVPLWNTDVIRREYLAVIKNMRTRDMDEEAKKRWFDNLLTAVFITHARVLSSVRITGTERDIPLKIPNGRQFIFQCYVQCARRFYQKPQIFDDALPPTMLKDNLRDAYDTIKETIQDTIMFMLPTPEILAAYFTESPPVAAPTPTSAPVPVPVPVPSIQADEQYLSMFTAAAATAPPPPEVPTATPPPPPAPPSESTEEPPAATKKEEEVTRDETTGTVSYLDPEDQVQYIGVPKKNRQNLPVSAGNPVLAARGIEEPAATAEPAAPAKAVRFSKFF